MLDQTDLNILELLLSNSRMQWQEIGEQVHLTGQAVKNRIDRMEKLGVIEGYTIKLDRKKLGVEITAFVTIYMKTTDHNAFHNFIKASRIVEEAHRVSGEGCYLLKVYTSNQEELVQFLDEILKYGNYKVNLSITQIK